MKLITVPGPVAEKILEALQQRTTTEHGRTPIVEQVPDAREHFIMIGGTPATTEATFDTFTDAHPGAGIVRFSATPRLVSQIPPDWQLFVGSRVWSRDVQSGPRSTSIRTYPMHVIAQEGIKDICDTVMESAKDFPALYVSIDLSVLDPAFAPGASAEPGGLTTRELLYFLHRLKLLKNFSAADIVGVPPAASSELIQLAAKIIAELS